MMTRQLAPSEEEELLRLFTFHEVLYGRLDWSGETALTLCGSCSFRYISPTVSESEHALAEHGRALHPEMVTKGRKLTSNTGPCGMTGCEKPARVKGLCFNHVRLGNLWWKQKLGQLCSHWGCVVTAVEDSKYCGPHTERYEHATAHGACVGCFNPAVDFTRYLCAKCAKIRDRSEQQSREHNAAVGA